MPRKAQKARKPNDTYHIVINLPGWLKNEIVELCRKEKTGVNQWILWLLKEAVEAQKGLPPAPPPQAPLPDIAAQLRAYFSGEKLMNPCGQTDCEPDIVQLQNEGFCRKCRVRAY